ncbi:hypothetical protein PN462_02830 [Spirulina sp. CS-785/01]|uniref:hypothetical protein n=1 Tax=Spirulina sp. CS-785/01 TaxID=3021716 RepID=UPI00232FB999|nr:hypothetical protein [Spirulina sp. CS-785/01]MDB9312021.1 hypothetical protein [Spirulina sp. CS-785/01]
MMLNFLNGLSKLLLGVELLELSRQASYSKSQFQHAQQLAQQKRFNEAIAIGEEILSFWSPCHSIFQHFLYRVWGGNLLQKVQYYLGEWHKKRLEVEQLIQSANSILETETEYLPNPQALSNALKLYQTAYSKHEDRQIQQAMKRCHNLFQWRQQYQSLVTEAKQLAQDKFFQQAYSYYQEAERIFATDEVQTGLIHVATQLEREKSFESSLSEVYQLSQEGNFTKAITVLEAALSQFPRSDGQKLLAHLKAVAQGIALFQAGINAEKQGDFNTAFYKYLEVQKLLPDIKESCLAKGSAAIQMKRWNQAISCIKEVNGEKGNYIRGFAYAKQGDWQQAKREWQSLTHPQVKPQRELLGRFVERERLLMLQEIEQLVDNECLIKAQYVSSDYLRKFGSDEQVERNLSKHIQPRLDRAVWKSGDWGEIAKFAENQWLPNRDIVSLHNWAIAAYYHAQIDWTQLEGFIVSWSTAIVNLNKDPSLKSLPWRNFINTESETVASHLQKILEDSIDALKDTPLKNYLHFRDIYRREMAALRFLKANPISAPQFNNLSLTPGCWKRSSISTQININIPDKTVASLYTNWGLAVAACLEEDTERAMQIKPKTLPNHSTEKFAQALVSYYEGRHYLQHQQWRDAISPLKQARQEIQKNTDWKQEIDQLCQKQRYAISDFKEHLAFAEFWYYFLGSPSARSYLAEYKAEKIREELVANDISEAQASRELDKLRKIDAENPVVLDLAERIEVAQELQKIEKLMKGNNFEKVVQQAKKSHHQQVRTSVAEIVLKIFVEGFSKRDFSLEEVIKLGDWAYELCPDSKDVQDIYNISQEFKPVQNLMKQERFEDAVRYAKLSSCEYLRDYLADFLMLNLIDGLKTKRIPPEVIYQIGKFIYDLCPHHPEYQKIYYDLGLINYF